MNVALYEATNSELTYKIGCCLTRRGRIVETGHNKFSSEKTNKFLPSIHAEMDCINKLINSLRIKKEFYRIISNINPKNYDQIIQNRSVNYKKRKYKLFISGICNGKLKCSKPCKMCHVYFEVCKFFGIYLEVYYINNSGEISKYLGNPNRFKTETGEFV